MRCSFSALLGALALSACVPNRATIPNELDPSNPQAEEAPLPAASTALAPHNEPPIALFARGDAGPAAAPVDAAPVDARPPARTPAAASYVCPMHPEVAQAGPGKCPKCGMNLVQPAGAR